VQATRALSAFAEKLKSMKKEKCVCFMLYVILILSIDVMNVEKYCCCCCSSSERLVSLHFNVKIHFRLPLAVLLLIVSLFAIFRTFYELFVAGLAGFSTSKSIVKSPFYQTLAVFLLRPFSVYFYLASRLSTESEANKLSYQLVFRDVRDDCERAEARTKRKEAKSFLSRREKRDTFGVDVRTETVAIQCLLPHKKASVVRMCIKALS
jgi:hypothetical protein